MLYSRSQLFKIIRGYTNRVYYNRDIRKIMYLKRLSMMDIPSVYYNANLSINEKYKRRLEWMRRRMKRRKNYRNFQRKYFRVKNKNITKILLKNKPYIITFKSFFSNFFIMLTDYYGNPLISCCTGQVANSRSKKRKNSLTLIHPMMRKVKLVLLRHRIKHLVIHIKTDISEKVMTAIKFLHNSRYKFNIYYMAILKPIPHHFGRRQRKPRRV